MASTMFGVVLLVCALKFSATQTSCKSRCGAEYYRGYTCQCDYTCLSYGECCKDFESQCTTRNSCKGRCGEPFKRGRLCNCDSDCVKYNQCCSDYKLHCDAEEEINGAASETAPMKSNSCDNVNDNKPKDPDLSEATDPSSTFSEGNNADDPVTLLDSPTYSPDTVTDDMYGPTFPIDEFPDNGVEDPEPSPAPESTSGYGPSKANLLEVTTETAAVFPQTDDDNLFTPGESPAESTDAMDLTGSPQLNSEVTTNPTPLMLDSTGIPEITTFNAEGNSDDVTTSPTSLTTDLEDPSTSVSPAGEELDAVSTNTPSSTAAAQDDTTGLIEADQLATTIPTTPQIPEPAPKPQDEPDAAKPLPAKPTPKPGTKPLDTAQTLNTDDPKDYQADDSNDTDLCSGRPVGGVTTLRNGTIVVFRGHYFWLLDQNRIPGPARGITEVWGVPSPIDTVFTRCNCQGKTYIFKGSRYWRFENEVLDPGYPKVIETGFDGLRGHITAALSVPQYQRRREAVYFFKRGGSVQKYSYQFGTSPSCGRKVQYAVYTVRNRVVRQASVSVLEPAINIRTSWKGFPSTITAAVSIPSNREPEGYKYYVFSRSKSYNVRMNSDRPVITAPKANASPQTNDFITCPKKV